MIEDLVLGSGDEAHPGDTVTVRYVGTLDDGKVFDATAKRGPFTVQIGLGHLIRGWELGIPGMREGGQRRLVIPPGLAYGDRAMGIIPRHATLHFDITLVSVKHTRDAGP